MTDPYTKEPLILVKKKTTLELDAIFFVAPGHKADKLSTWV